jgi:hypothetical protein
VSAAVRLEDSAATAAEYEQILLAARRRQLQATQANLRRLESTFDAAARRLVATLEELPADDVLSREYVLQVLHQADSVIVDLALDFPQLLDAGMIELAQEASERESRIEALAGLSADGELDAGLTRNYTLSDGAELSVAYGRTAGTAVERLATRYYADGLRLADRLYAMSDGTRTVVENMLLEGVAEGRTVRQVARRLEPALTEAGASNPRYQAMRIARTEVNNAYREATILAAKDPDTGALKPHLLGVRYALSGSHPTPDICDIWATHDSGHGPGVYAPDEVPIDHPNGLCSTSPCLLAYPNVGASGPAIGEARPNDVPQSEIDYYAERGDVPARGRV